VRGLSLAGAAHPGEKRVRAVICVTLRTTGAMHKMHPNGGIMRTTIDIDDAALEEAQQYAPGLTKTALIAEALRAFARQEARKAILAGALHTPEFELPPRRKLT
jgi:Arc/MetJ family transcription regulator